MKTNRALNEDMIFDELTTREKTYWFKTAHRAIQTNVRKNKWLKNDDGREHTDRCQMCKYAIETWEHYEYECDVLHSIWTEWMKCMSTI